MRILFRERDALNRRWSTLVDEQVESEFVAVSPLTLSEASELAFEFFTDVHPSPDVRLRVGDVVVASSLRSDRPDFLLRPPYDAASDSLGCSGRLLRDWAGQTELKVEVRQSGDWRVALVAGLSIAAGKMEQEAFEALCREIAAFSAEILLDVYGKTFIGLEPERRFDESAPIAVLGRLRQTLDKLAVSLRAVAHQPAYRLKTSRLREPALAEQSVSDLTLEEVCLDPTLAVRDRGGVRFREHVREVAAPNFDLPEHRMISGFLGFLNVQINDLRGRMQRDIRERLERRAYRHRRTDPDARTWWEQEDLPRIEEMQKLLNHLAALEMDLAQLRRHPFLPPAGRLTEVPASTPLIRSHRAYAQAYKALVGHFTAFRVHLDEGHLLTRARSLPQLYEVWCLLQVFRVLQGCLQLREPGPFDRSSPFRRLEEGRERFVLELTPDQTVSFTDEDGRLVRLRYIPSYRAFWADREATYGFLGLDSERTPDLAVEVFAGSTPARPPELIVVLDAKYSSDPHALKLDEVRSKYGKLGVFRTGRVLSRQVWALTPSAARGRGPARPEWASFCTVDNTGFWSDQFDFDSSVAGVVQAKPNMPAGRSPLESLLRRLLKLSGLRLRGG